jgi:hypothetical protein
MNDELRQWVRRRANQRCEYCHFPETFSFLPFQIDHIIAEKHLGPTVESNLAWTCYYCNSFKGPNLSGWHLATESVVRLFHPRRDAWDEHFLWTGPRLVGLTEIGNVTIHVLNINHSDAVEVRRWLLAIGEQLT